MNYLPNLQQYWQQLTSKYAGDQSFIDNTFQDIIHQYAGTDRHYHNLQHLSHLLLLASTHKAHINDTDSVYFAIFFHDLIYHVQRTDNEALSAAAAVRFLHCIRYPEALLQKTTAFINATKSHLNETGDPDLDILLDMDLSILGAAPAQYHRYTQQIRREYDIYPDDTYIQGRKQVLQHFLQQPTIYKTNLFRLQYEEQARTNLQTEWETLQKQTD